ncbi:MAG: hypothetical protein K2O01_09180, partial [Bacteroidales bacterium]|nr:hypothetical protein [Bacteroidales bacterium]
LGNLTDALDGGYLCIDDIEIIQEAAATPAGVNLSFTFDDEASFTENWNVYNGNAGMKWVWSNGELRCEFRGSSDANNWIYTKNKVHLAAGKATIRFKYRSQWGDDAVQVGAYYGTSFQNGATGLTEIGTKLSTESSAYELAEFEFDVAEAGDYVFCLGNLTDALDGGYLCIDDIEIIQEAAEPTPEDRLDLVLSELVLPVSSMTLGNAETIGVKVTNKGTVEITKITLTYTVNEGIPVEQTFEEALAANASTTLTFTQKADFSAAGAYVVAVAVKSVEAAAEATENPEGNSLSGHVTHLAPHTLPYSCTFETAEEFAEQWNVFSRSDATAKAWTWGDKIELYPNPVLPEGEGGFAYAKSTDTPKPVGVTNNYLISAVPFSLKAKQNVNMSFTYRKGGTSTDVGAIEVYYALSNEVDEDQSGLYLFGAEPVPNDLMWHDAVMQLEIASDGDYYIIIKHAGGVSGYVAIDNLSVTEGVFVGTPDLAVS